jgi:hypothetical protein
MMADTNVSNTQFDEVRKAAKAILTERGIHAALGQGFAGAGKGFKLAVRVQGYRNSKNQIEVPRTSSATDVLMNIVEELLSGPQTPEPLKSALKDIAFIGVPRAG